MIKYKTMWFAEQLLVSQKANKVQNKTGNGKDVLLHIILNKEALTFYFKTML